MAGLAELLSDAAGMRQVLGLNGRSIAAKRPAGL
jgi:hypothetical protein